MAGPVERIVLLHTSPRLPAGLLTARAWDLVRAAPVYTGADSPQAGALRAAGVRLDVLDGAAGEQAETLLSADADTVVWLAGPDGDLALARALSQRLVGAARSPQIEAEYGSWDPPGARLLDAVAVIDTLRTSCPWDREQTHASLAPYLLEEAYEAYDAIGSGDRGHLREELGDVLLQVVFHARVGAEDAGGTGDPGRTADAGDAQDTGHAGDTNRDEDAGGAVDTGSPVDTGGAAPPVGTEGADGGRFDIDDVAAGLVDKLVRRHPHVFADVTVSDAAEVHRNWEDIKRAEKSRESAMDGVPLGQPALSLAQKLLSRAGVRPATDPADSTDPADPTGSADPAGPEGPTGAMADRALG
ncbi:MAG: MazG family protein, partial [Actinocatenispora sp.]